MHEICQIQDLLYPLCAQEVLYFFKTFWFCVYFHERQDLLYPLTLYFTHKKLLNFVFSFISLVFWIYLHEICQIQDFVSPVSALADFFCILYFQPTSILFLIWCNQWMWYLVWCSMLGWMNEYQFPMIYYTASRTP